MGRRRTKKKNKVYKLWHTFLEYYKRVNLLSSSCFREEAERQRLHKLENERRQREEMEKEQELLRKKMIEQRLVSLVPF